MNATGTVQPCEHCGAKNRVPAAARGKPRCGRCHRDLAWIVDATSADFADVAESARPLVVVDLWAPWCGPCRVISPILAELARERAGQLKVVKVNVDEEPDLAARFEARSIPTLVLLRHGDTLDRRVGLADRQTLLAWIDSHLEAPTGSA